MLDALLYLYRLVVGFFSFGSIVVIESALIHVVSCLSPEDNYMPICPVPLAPTLGQPQSL